MTTNSHCSYCGNPLAPAAKFCSICGRAQEAPAADYTTGSPAQPASEPQPPPLPAQPRTLPYVPNYLVQAIIVTVFCCIPFGIVAIVFAAQVNTKLAWNDIPGAVSSSQNAKKWCWIAFGTGIVTKGLIFGIQIINIALAMKFHH